MTPINSRSPRDFRALAHRLVFHWRDDALRMTAIEANLQAALERVASLEAEVAELRENSVHIAELVDLVEQQLTPKRLD